MSLEIHFKEKKCLVKKLDFDRCVIGGFKAERGRRRKKRMRAMFTRDEETLDKTPERTSTRKSEDPVETTTTASSPVLLSKRLAVPDISSSRTSSKQNPETSNSPVFRCREGIPSLSRAKKIFHSKRKISFGEETIRHSPELVQGSPVFKIKVAKRRKSSLSNSDESNFTIEDLTQKLTQSGASIENLSFESSEKNSNRFREFSLDTASSPHASSMETQDVDVSIVEFSEDEKMKWSQDYNQSRIDQSTTNHLSRPHEEHDKLNRKTYRKSNLLTRLRTIQSKQYSEKLLWKHRNSGKNLQEEIWILEDHWNADGNHVLKCVAEISSKETHRKYVFTDAQWISRLNADDKRLRMRIKVHPPWHTVVVGKPEMTFLLNALSVEPYEKIPWEPKEVNEPRLKSELVDDQGDGHVGLFYETLLAFPVSPFLL